MKAYEIYETLIRDAAKRWEEDTCDGLILGDPNKEVKKLATCFKLNMALVDRAVAEGVDMVITHEPTFSREDPCSKYLDLDEKRLQKLQESGLTVYRYHDHAHDRLPDYIHDGFWNALGFQGDIRPKRLIYYSNIGWHNTDLITGSNGQKTELSIIIPYGP